MSMIGDFFKGPLVDPMNHGMYGVSQAKIEDTGTHYAQVRKYYPLTHTADVVFIGRAGYHPNGVRIKLQEHYQGPTPGTGEANAVYEGQIVDVVFIGGAATGIINHGAGGGSRYTYKDAHPPAYAPFQTAGTGKVVVHPTKDGRWGNAEHTDSESNYSRTNVGKSNYEDWGNQHEVINGPNITRSEELTRRSAEGHHAAASRLGVS